MENVLWLFFLVTSKLHSCGAFLKSTVFRVLEFFFNCKLNDMTTELNLNP